ncbi:hypothetical protein [Janthinobacterium sp. UMAB-56]|uniref:hypothetical protein n=1 Tax=Janthinobacterium sp. UMAB-56 TaxID=1365361 RepID=UPI001C5792D3|nr:hypothetical protein [Janthinobacterium sp. UMAB-56]
MELKADMPLARPPMPPAAEPVFCKDCLHFATSPARRFPQCTSPDVRLIDLVYGYQPIVCVKARSNNDFAGLCGPSGKLFVKAHP